MSQENLDAFHRMLKDFQRGDFDAWIGSFSEDAEFIPRRAPIEGDFRGHEGLRRFLADTAETFDVFHPDYDDVQDVGDHVLALGTLRLRGKGGGVEMEVTSALVGTFRDGKLVRFQDFGDPDKALAAVGLSE